MKYALSPLAFTLGVSAAALKRPDCCFQLTASGGASGTVGQLNDGQNRVGGGYGAAKYCINSAGGITDANHRGCILTPPTKQFQCDQGVSPTTGFSVGGGGEVTYNGSTQFYACPAADGEYNIYTKPVDGQSKCVEITLSTQGKCASGGGQAPSASTPVPVSTSVPVASSPPPAGTPPSPSAPAGSGAPSSSSTVTSTLTQSTTECPTTRSSPQSSAVQSAPPIASPPPAQSTPQPSQPAGTPSQPAGTTPSPSACPTDLAGAYQYPHLIIPVNASAPSTAYGTQYNGTVSRGVCSLFNFDIPAAWAGATCSAVFLLPAKRELQTSDYALSGGSIAFDRLSAPASASTAWDSVPPSGGRLGAWRLAPGTRFVVESGACEAGATVAYEACGEGGLELEWFQDWNPSPIGLFVRKC
ncbi:Ubiquitin 3 binding protein But2 [Neofusicoccum parvum]|nr:Ubiquitin 3 binding protein But2 [Neofusicoccum parvum]